MKQLIVYYSLDGNSDYIAKKLAKETGADLLHLTTVKPFPTTGAMKYIKGGMSTVFGLCPKLAPYNFDADAYDCIILGCPVWAGRMASPMKSFLKAEQLKGRKLKLFLCHADEDGTKPLARFRAAVDGNTIVKEANFADPFSHKDRLSAEELREFGQAH